MLTGSLREACTIELIVCLPSNTSLPHHASETAGSYKLLAFSPATRPNGFVATLISTEVTRVHAAGAADAPSPDGHAFLFDVHLAIALIAFCLERIGRHFASVARYRQDVFTWPSSLLEQRRRGTHQGHSDSNVENWNAIGIS